MTQIKQRIKLIGQLPNEKPVDLELLDINSETPQKCETLVKEYSTIFPDIKIIARKGNFKKQISKAQKEALSNLIFQLQSPMVKLISSLN